MSFSWWFNAAVAAGLLLLFTGIYRGRLFLAVPLICLGACFVVYLADTLLSIHHVRKLWREIRFSGQEPRFPDSGPGGPSGLAGTDDDRRGLRVSDARRAYHDNHRIIGARTSLRKVEFDVGLQKQLDAGKPIERFKTSELIMHIGFHVISQGVGELQDYAHGIWSTRPTEQPCPKATSTHDSPNQQYRARSGLPGARDQEASAAASRHDRAELSRHTVRGISP